jgi:DNA-binding FadR family transcriptional regulator
MVAEIFREARQDSIRYARDLRVAADEHRAIYQAIRAGDGERARRAMRDHLVRAERTQVEEEQIATPDRATAGR